MSRLLQGALVVSIIASSLMGACEARQRVMPMPGAVNAKAMAVDDAAGFWRIVGAKGAGTCLMALSRFPAPGGGYGVQIEACTIPAFAASAAWRPIEGGFELTSASGDKIATFHRQSVDDFGSVEGGYRLERAPLA